MWLMHHCLSIVEEQMVLVKNVNILSQYIKRCQKKYYKRKKRR